VIEILSLVGLLDLYKARRRRWMRDIANANARTQDFIIHEFARLPIEHHELVKALRSLRGDEAEK
jgi:hypothetical protein